MELKDCRSQYPYPEPKTWEEVKANSEWVDANPRDPEEVEPALPLVLSVVEGLPSVSDDMLSSTRPRNGSKASGE
jgi:hypothetical protein